MCQINTFMFKEGELDGEKMMEIIRIFQEAGFTNFYEYTNPKLRNIRRDLRTFQCGNFCDCGSVLTKKVKVDEMMEAEESKRLTNIITKTLDVVGTTYLFSHWYKGSNVVGERVMLERASRRVPLSSLGEDTYRSMFYDEVIEVTKE
ncbi:MAG: hypothetical protein E7354_05210 [Clostridiales bacterium]|nr:hypothetical protein [Clostridiales bacterium]